MPSSRKGAEDDRKTEESHGNVESESPLLNIIESNSKELKRNDNDEGDNEHKTGSEPIARIRLSKTLTLKMILENPQSQTLMNIRT